MASPLKVGNVQKVTSLLLGLASFAASIAFSSAPPASAATSYVLKWDFEYSARFIHKDQSVNIKWATTSSSAPSPTATAPASAPCDAVSYKTAFSRTWWYAKYDRVRNGQASQECDVTLRATQNGSFRGSPGSITRTYVVLSNEYISSSNTSWCVSSCKYTDGTTRAIFRSRISGQCYVVYYSPKENGNPGHGTSNITPCPNTLTIDAPASSRQGTRFNVLASSNLGIDVLLTTSTPGICRVVSTQDPENHTVVGTKTGVCRMTATTASSSLWRTPTPVSDRTNITGCAPNCPVIAPTASPDEFSTSYATPLTASVLSNDTGSAPLRVALTTQPSSGTLTLSQDGTFSFQPAALFAGDVSFSYTLSDSTGLTDTASVTIHVGSPTAPPPPAIERQLRISAPAWMRLGVKEAISVLPTASCTASSTPTPAVLCGTLPSSGDVVGSYLRITQARLYPMTVTAPANYPSSRYTVMLDPSAAPVVSLHQGATGYMKFSQATAVGAKFSISVPLDVTYQEVTWTNINGILNETATEKRTVVSVTKSFGVTGATR
jgi:hypothetical protein